MGTFPQFFSTIFCFVALVYDSFFFSEQPFFGNYSTLDSHTNTVISRAVAHLSRWLPKPCQGLYPLDGALMEKKPLKKKSVIVAKFYMYGAFKINRVNRFSIVFDLFC